VPGKTENVTILTKIKMKCVLTVKVL